MLTPYLPYPPISGGRTRTYNLIKRLRRDCEITLVCFGRPEEQSYDIMPLRELCETHVIDRAPSPGTLQAAILSLTSIKPITMRLYRSAVLMATLARLLEERHYDVIHVESFYMLQNLPQPCSRPILLAEPAIEYIAWWRHAKVAQPLYQRPAIALEALKMRVFEPQDWRCSQMLGAMSQIDANIMRRVTPAVPTMLAPNGVDEAYFQPGTAQRAANVGLFMGDYKYFPNTDAIIYFCAEIMPLIRAKRPDFQLQLLGKEPPAELRALADDPDSGLRLLGLVDDTRPYLTKATMFVCPLRSGSGTRFKLLEALACGLPVVSTTLGAEGLGAVDKEHMLIADSPQAFAEAVLRLLDQPNLAAHLAQTGRAWVVENHSWQRSAALLIAAYQELAGEKTGRLAQ
jgi:glycosyltransferase involved in cell wall biosynthesis